MTIDDILSAAKKEKMTWKKSVLIAAMIFNTLMYIVFAVTTPEASVGMCIALLFNFFSFRSVIRRDAGVAGLVFCRLSPKNP